ncbi:MAG: adenosylcobinamide-phosphate synthase CbiB [Paenibacillus macerans]|uniref:Cobalamin biosynthesis protein CobD n=3 Tax=Paenibacillus macerans TaxID=44252 RepID=A0A6N8F165_PAEMA|nr:adenosylcobinamide-phosphate synthase CbiB [Paenibacillus macerans]MBS5909761.1 cobalamin biosynthesis protein CobD [Paenibacillus macerans]MDU7474681.1 adenosylcobinamide-phosphate synthase CbiB [Paenibacillus macerans]MUG24272.1 cobalamin biosynthesis protein CobD [Paenibacillus macerans]UMV50285.1 adenosylcobinamide-phosphate synthase CbiB [Paenibacillus macerans]SUA85046.1 cobalamin biosynthesis protein cobd [Paenibacillus macerans]
MTAAWWVLPVAYLLDRLLGDPRWLPHPVVGMGKAVAALEAALRRLVPPRRYRAAGVLLPLLVAGGSFALTWAALRLLAQVSPWLAALAEAALIWTTIAAKGLRDAGMDVHGHLLRGDLPGARRSLGMIVGRDTAHLDAPEITRGAVETVAENIVDAVVSPLFFALLGGAPLAMAYRAVNTLDSMVGYKNDKYIDLGWASARLDDIANFIPARLTALLLVAAAWTLRLDAARAWRTVRRDAPKHPSPNSGRPEAAVAGALGVRLGGKNSYRGVVSFRAYMGDKTRELEPQDIPRTAQLLFWVAGVFVLLGTALWIWRSGGIAWI